MFNTATIRHFHSQNCDLCTAEIKLFQYGVRPPYWIYWGISACSNSILRS